VNRAQRAATPTPTQQELEALLGGIRLRFPEPLASTFREDYNRRWLLTNRVAFTAGILLIASFGVIDVWAAPHHLAQIWALRFGVCCTLTIAMLLISGTHAYLRWMQPIGATVVVVAGAALIAMNAIFVRDEAVWRATASPAGSSHGHGRGVPARSVRVRRTHAHGREGQGADADVLPRG
jgi:hypothetical protein